MVYSHCPEPGPGQALETNVLILCKSFNIASVQGQGLGSIALIIFLLV